MKHVIHSATGQYEFVESEWENGDPYGIIENHNAVVREVKGEPAGVGLGDKEWRALIDAYLNNKPYDYESVIERLNEKQRWALNQIKLSRVRTKKIEEDDYIPAPRDLGDQ